ncbi:MAG: M28 family peptidase [Bacteroidota bacterium]|nr:M28 family peptidase [Bacteroidota bacterium]
MKAKIHFFTLLLFISLSTHSQDIAYAKNVIDTLCTTFFNGRGYAYSGDSLAADYLKNELTNFTDEVIYQHFSLSVNSLHGESFFSIGEDSMAIGKDYLPSAFSCPVSDTFEYVVFDKDIYYNKSNFRKFLQQDHFGQVLIIDTTGIDTPEFKDFYPYIVRLNYFGAAGIVELTEHLPPAVPASEKKDFFFVRLVKDKFSDNGNQVFITIENKFTPEYKTRNIIAKIGGTSDSALVFTAHYDHVGSLDSAVFIPGANDNASGTAMVLNLAKYFAEQDNAYTMYFILFSGEELGLKGSQFYADHPVFPLNKIKFLINLDMVGSGSKGIQVVNGSVHPSYFNRLQALNAGNNFLPAIKIRGAAANSDHYPFHAKGVKSFFIYTLGEYKEYHNINDRAEALPLTKFEPLMKLLIAFSNEF